MSIKKVFCQDKPISILQRALSVDRLAHSYIFAGRDGIGKFETAFEWAKVLLCLDPVQSKKDQTPFLDSCGKCKSCIAMEASSHPDFNHIYKELLEFTRDGKGKKTPIDLPKDVVTEFLVEKIQVKPTLSAKRVFIVSEAEKLNASSQNSLLKVLEEPPIYCSIILLCTKMDKLLPTIKSRCQVIRFGPIEETRITDHLEQIGLDPKISKYFARLSQGSIGQAAQWANLELQGANLYKTKTNLIKSLSTYKYSDSLELAQFCLDETKRLSDNWQKLDESTSKADINRRAIKTLLQIVISAMLDAMKLRVNNNDDQQINFDQQPQIQILAHNFTADSASNAISNCYELIKWVDSSTNDKLIFEQLLLNLADTAII